MTVLSSIWNDAKLHGQLASFLGIIYRNLKYHFPVSTRVLNLFGSIVENSTVLVAEFNRLKSLKAQV